MHFVIGGACQLGSIIVADEEKVERQLIPRERHNDPDGKIRRYSIKLMMKMKREMI
jgi:hypothetical protein